MLLAATPENPQQRGIVAQVAGRIAAELAKLEADLAETARLGIGSPAPLTEANTSYEQARTAAQISGRIGQLVTSWEDHPLEGVLKAVQRAEVDATAIPPMLAPCWVASRTTRSPSSAASTMAETSPRCCTCSGHRLLPAAAIRGVHWPRSGRRPGAVHDPAVVGRPTGS